jgi:hypothetical protein
VFVDQLERFSVVARKLYALPPFRRQVGSFDRFDVEVETSSRGVGANRGISRVGKWTGLFAAETGHIVLVATESLVLGSLEFETAKVGTDDGPHEIVYVCLAFSIGFRLYATLT